MQDCKKAEKIRVRYTSNASSCLVNLINFKDCNNNNHNDYLILVVVVTVEVIVIINDSNLTG